MPIVKRGPNDPHPFAGSTVIFNRPLSPPRTRDLTEAELARIPPEDRELVARLRREVYDAFEAAISKYEAEQ